MSDIHINRLLFETLDRVRQLESPKVSMWAIDNRYAYPPYLRFRFKNTSPEDNIYKLLSDIVLKFQGSLKWQIIHDENRSTNFLILPLVFSRFLSEANLTYEMKSFLKFMSQDAYESYVDKAISDVPNLAKFIEEQYEILK